MIITKEYDYQQGKNYNATDFTIVVNETKKVYLKNKDHLLFSFHKNAIDNEKYFPLLEKYYKDPILTSRNRKKAMGKDFCKSCAPTGLLGYIDCLTPQQKNRLKGIGKGARKTKFLIEKEKGWTKTVSLYHDVDQIYQVSEPTYYKQQKKEYNKIHKNLKIRKTNFTTITVNRNFRTATHTDKGDLKTGLSCLVCIGNDKFKGGYLGFPKQKVLVKMEPGDVILMDSHEPHCNTEIHLEKDGVRFGLVCYVREKMKDYRHPIVVDEQEFFLTEKDFERFSHFEK